MENRQMTRRSFMLLATGAAVVTVFPGCASEVGLREEEIRALQRVARLLYPHENLSDDVYKEVLNASSIGPLGNGLYPFAFVVRMNALDDILRSQDPIGFADGTFAVKPLWLDRIQPRAFRGQFAGKNANPTLLLHPLVVLTDPVLNVVAGVPGGLIPNKCPNVGAPIIEPFANPLQKGRRHLGDRSPGLGPALIL